MDWIRFLQKGICGPAFLILMLGVGLYLSIQLRFVQIRQLPKAIRVFIQKICLGTRVEDGRSSFRALCTALAATVGTGNIVGVAGAISIGGPGAVFWMWISGLLGMAIKYAEVTLALRYRKKDREGYLGGPMYVITEGLGQRWKPLAQAYCALGIAASLGIGNAAQINAVVCGINTIGGRSSWGRNLLIGILVALVMGRLLRNGAGKIGAAAEILVPFAALGYLLLCSGVLVRFHERLPEAFHGIITGAFTPKAATGGMIGSAFLALQTGCSRGIFTNEAGMGTAAIAHASAEVAHPVQQGLMGILEVFLDTIVICTLTALVILVSGVPIPFGTDPGAALTIEAFSAVYGKAAPVLITGAIALFALATVLGWGFYGIRCAQFLAGEAVLRPFAWIHAGTSVLASVWDTASVWQFSEMLNSLMAVPNMLSLILLTTEVRSLTQAYRHGKLRSE